MSLLNEWEPRNLSDREAYRLRGYLSPARMGRLINLAERVDPDLIDPACLGDAAASYPAEDFLQEVIDDLRDIVTDAEPDELRRLVERLEEIQTEESQSAEYGREVIYDYQKEVARVTE